MNLEAKIKSWIQEGLSDLEIAEKVLADEEGKSLLPDQIAEKIVLLKKSQEVQKKLLEAQKAKEAKENELKNKTEIDQKIKNAVDEQLKAIQLNLGQYKSTAPYKRFNYDTGEYYEVQPQEAEAYKHFNLMFGALLKGDQQSALSLSNEIEQDNQKRLVEMGLKTSSVSDVDSRGGFTVPVTVDEMIMQFTYTMAPIWALTRKAIVNYNSHVIPTMGNFTVQWLADQDTEMTESNPTFYNPTVQMKRCAILTAISKTFLEQKGMDLANMFIQGMASAFARDLDLMIVAGSVIGNSDLFNGLVFDTYTSRPTAYALSSITDQKLYDMTLLINDEADTTLRYIANRKVLGKIGFLENGAGNRIFPNFSNSSASNVTPFGIPIIQNNKISSTFDVGAGKRTTGSDDVLILADLDKVATMVSQSTRIETSGDAQFTKDNLMIKAVKKYGQKVLSSSSTLGVVAVAQELTAS